jgi:hypothetical protein
MGTHGANGLAGPSSLAPPMAVAKRKVAEGRTPKPRSAGSAAWAPASGLTQYRSEPTEQRKVSWRLKSVGWVLPAWAPLARAQPAPRSMVQRRQEEV